MVYLVIAFRNLNRQKRRTILLAGAIAFGVFIITLLNGFTAGIIRNVEQNMAQMTSGHVFITAKERSASGRELPLIRDPGEIEAAIASLDAQERNTIVSEVRRSSFIGTLVFGKKSYIQRVEGINWEKDPELGESLAIVSGSLAGIKERNAVVLSNQTAKKLGVEVGETVLVKLTTITGQQNVGELKVTALTVDAGLFGSFSAYARLEDVNALLNMGEGNFQQLTLRLRSINDIDRFSNKLYDELGKRVQVADRIDFASGGESASSHGRGMGRMLGLDLGNETELWRGVRYEMTTLNDLLSNFKSVVSVLDIVGLAILLILLLITMVGIVNTFRMIMLERIREIGTMRAMGVQREGVRWIFLFEALFLASIGVIGGVILAGIAITLVSILVSIPTDSPLYFFMYKGHPIFELILPRLAGNYALVAVLSLAAAFFPARSAARLDPAHALRIQK